MSKIRKTPGVFIEEQNAFPNSGEFVPTNIPVFIGYTEKASDGNQDLKNKPSRIASLIEFERYFGGAPKTSYNIAEAEVDPGYVLTLNSNPFLLYHSMKLFFANGGSNCYIVSIGDYDSTIDKDDFIGVNPDGTAKGINTLLDESEPTLLLAPDALLLGKEDFAEVQKAMLQHCGIETKNRFAILDIYDGFMDFDRGQDDVISTFRNGIGNVALGFGAAYYPWLETTIVEVNEINFENIDKKSIGNLVEILNKSIDESLAKNTINNETANRIRVEIAKLNDEDKDVKMLHQTLLAGTPLYKEIISSIITKINLLPPSGAMAGIYSRVDDERGVFKAPANVNVASVIKPSVNITNEKQEDLNVPLDGKAVNAIRSFPGKGALVWGARTLDGNSLDWRYVSVRRTMIMIEQSARLVTQSFVFEPNDQTTWLRIKDVIGNLMTNLWQQGGLAGSTPEDAFSVGLGLGETMTPMDILEGKMFVSIRVAATRPAEFIIVNIEQQMATS